MCRIDQTAKLELIQAINGLSQVLYTIPSSGFPGDGNNGYYYLESPVPPNTINTLPINLSPYPTASPGYFGTTGSRTYFIKVSNSTAWNGDFKVVNVFITYTH